MQKLRQMAIKIGLILGLVLQVQGVNALGTSASYGVVDFLNTESTLTTSPTYKLNDSVDYYGGVSTSANYQECTGDFAVLQACKSAISGGQGPAPIPVLPPSVGVGGIGVGGPYGQGPSPVVPTPTPLPAPTPKPTPVPDSVPMPGPIVQPVETCTSELCEKESVAQPIRPAAVYQPVDLVFTSYIPRDAFIVQGSMCGILDVPVLAAKLRYQPNLYLVAAVCELNLCVNGFIHQDQMLFAQHQQYSWSDLMLVLLLAGGIFVSSSLPFYSGSKNIKGRRR